MKQNNSILAHLLTEDRDKLFDFNQKVMNLYFQKKELIWEKLDHVLSDLIQFLPFERIVNSLPIPDKYHRISLSSPESPIDVVAIIMKADIHKGAVVLLNTYDSHEPNGIIYSDKDIINPLTAQSGHILCSTPPHNHKAICHSHVAWIKDRACITEQIYQLQEDNRLKIIHNDRKILYQNGLDSTMGKTIHSISVDLY